MCARHRCYVLKNPFLRVHGCLTLDVSALYPTSARSHAARVRARAPVAHASLMFPLASVNSLPGFTRLCGITSV